MCPTLTQRNILLNELKLKCSLQVIKQRSVRFKKVEKANSVSFKAPTFQKDTNVHKLF